MKVLLSLLCKQQDLRVVSATLKINGDHFSSILFSTFPDLNGSKNQCVNALNTEARGRKSVRTHPTTVSVHVKFLNNCHLRTHCAWNSAKSMLWSCFRRFFFSLLLPGSTCFLNYLFGEPKPHRGGLYLQGVIESCNGWMFIMFFFFL